MELLQGGHRARKFHQSCMHDKLPLSNSLKQPCHPRPQAGSQDSHRSPIAPFDMDRNEFVKHNSLPYGMPRLHAKVLRWSCASEVSGQPPVCLAVRVPHLTHSTGPAYKEAARLVTLNGMPLIIACNILKGSQLDAFLPPSACASPNLSKLSAIKGCTKRGPAFRCSRASAACPLAEGHSIGTLPLALNASL